MRPLGGRVPFVAQIENVECGAACLTMVLAYHRHHAPLVELRRACAVSRDGANALAIVQAARTYGLEARGLKVTLDGVAKLPTPAIVHWAFNHFVVLERSTPSGGAWIVDPATGARFVPPRELAESFTGVVLVMSRGKGFRPRALRRRGSGRGAAPRSPRGTTSAMLSVLLSSLLLEALGLLLPAANQVVLDSVIRPHQERFLWIVGIALASALILRTCLAVARERILAGVRLALDVRLMASFVGRLTSLPLDFFQQRSAGDLASRVQSNADVREAFTAVFAGSLDALLALAYAALMLAYDARIGGIVVALAVARVLLVAATSRASRDRVARELIAGAKELEATHTMIAYPEAVRAFHAEATLLEHHRAGVVARLNVTEARRAMVDRALAVLPLLDGLGRAAVLWLGGHAVMRDQMTPGVFASFLAVSALLARPLSSVVSGVEQLETLGRKMERLDDVLESAPEPTGPAVLTRVRGDVRVEAASFRYGPRGPMLLSSIDVEARAGEVIAIVGTSGAGKSTLLKLLLGFAEPTEGRVTYDGVDLREIDRASLRRRIGVVSQDSYFFDEPVRDALRLYAPDATTADMVAALRAACIDDVIAALPGGLDARLGAGARSLSGGQRQRLALARALVHRPSVLVLDEATSSLDLDVERRVQDNLRRLGCTRIVVAHRLRTIRDADRIYVLDAGRVAQVGSHAELTRSRGPYRLLEGVAA